MKLFQDDFLDSDDYDGDDANELMPQDNWEGSENYYDHNYNELNDDDYTMH